MQYEGRIWKFGDSVNTDLIIPARFLNVSEEKELAKNCFADLRVEFFQSVKPGDIIMAGRNFGCGSSREHAPLALKAAGIAVVIAKSFARIFYRNAFNIGLPILESEAAVNAFQEGDRVWVDPATGEINGLPSGPHFSARPIPVFMRAIIEAGGLVPFVKQKGAF
jgi:3-isopropylmalate dehydratase small subunit